MAVSDYQKQGSNQCSLTAGQVVEVVEKNQHGGCGGGDCHAHLLTPPTPLVHAPGWWFITCTDNFSEGWVPANFLEPYDKETEENLNEVLSIGMLQGFVYLVHTHTRTHARTHTHITHTLYGHLRS